MAGTGAALGTLYGCSDAASSDTPAEHSGGEGGGGPSSTAGVGGATVAAGGQAGDGARCDCGDDPEFFHVPQGCHPLSRTLKEQLAFLQDTPNNALDWPSLVVQSTCPSGYAAIRVDGACEYSYSVIFDPQGRRLVERSDPDATKLCVAHGSDTGAAYDPAETCDRCTVAWHGWSDSGGAGAGGAYSDLDCYSDSGPFSACESSGGANGAGRGGTGAGGEGGP